MRRNPPSLWRFSGPKCTKCGSPTELVDVEPTREPGRDLRVFECPACGHTDKIKVKVN